MGLLVDLLGRSIAAAWRQWLPRESIETGGFVSGRFVPWSVAQRSVHDFHEW